MILKPHNSRNFVDDDQPIIMEKLNVEINHNVKTISELNKASPMKKYVLNPISMFFIGGILGILSKLFDIHTVLLGTLISIFNDTKKKAMMNILPFCIGMLIAYYLTAHFIHSVLY